MTEKVQSDQFTQDRFDWLKQVHSDHGLPPMAAKVGFWICSHINRQSGEAWPSQQTLAQEVGCSRKGLQIALETLIARGHLKAEVHKGRGKTNLYSMILRPEENANHSTHYPAENANASTHIETGKCEQNYALKLENAYSETAKCVISDRKMRTGVRTELFEELSEELIEGESLSPPPDVTSPSKPGPTADDHFQEWWQQYPRKVGKPAAHRAYRLIIKGRLATPAELLQGVLRYAAERDREPDIDKRRQFTAHPSTWLNQQRWKDEAEALPRLQSSTASTIDQEGAEVSEPTHNRARRSASDVLAG